MPSFKNFREWEMNEASQEREEARTLAPEFLKNFQNALREEGFTYGNSSSPLQVKNGTLVMNELKNDQFVKSKLEEFNFPNRVDTSRIEYKQLISKILNASPLGSGSLIAYSKGKLKYSLSNGIGFKFSPTKQGIEEKAIPWIKDQLLKNAFHVSRVYLKTDRILVDPSFKGYELSRKTLSLINASVEDFTSASHREAGSSDWASSQDFYQPLSKVSVEVQHMFSPLLVLAYLLKRAGLLEALKISGSPDYLSLSLEFKMTSDTKGYIRAVSESDLKLKRNKKDAEKVTKFTVEFPRNVKTYTDLLKFYPQIAKSLSIAQDSKIAEELEKIAHENRGLIASKKFGL